MTSLARPFAFNFKHLPCAKAGAHGRDYCEWLISLTYELHSASQQYFPAVYDAASDTVATLEAGIIAGLASVPSDTDAGKDVIRRVSSGILWHGGAPYMAVRDESIGGTPMPLPNPPVMHPVLRAFVASSSWTWPTYVAPGAIVYSRSVAWPGLSALVKRQFGAAQPGDQPLLDDLVRLRTTVVDVARPKYGLALSWAQNSFPNVIAVQDAKLMAIFARLQTEAGAVLTLDSKTPSDAATIAQDILKKTDATQLLSADLLSYLKGGSVPTAVAVYPQIIWRVADPAPTRSKGKRSRGQNARVVWMPGRTTPHAVVVQNGGAKPPWMAKKAGGGGCLP
jgi:hypothetical protein